jgi:hypothetical protein
MVLVIMIVINYEVFIGMKIKNIKVNILKIKKNAILYRKEIDDKLGITNGYDIKY